MNKTKFLACLAVSAMALTSAANAQNNNMGGGFSGPGTEISIVTIEQAKGMNDDVMVTLRGNIQQKVGDELYLFSDGSGTINVEIDDDDWNGMNIGPNDMVEIKGEVDKGWTSIEIDVDQINKINQ